MALVKMGNRTVGSTIKIKENGVPVEFYVAKHNYESGLNGSGRTLVVRKELYDKRSWSTLDTWLNGDYKNMLDPDIQAAMGTTKIYYTNNNAKTTQERAVFQLSATELGGSANYMSVEGTALSIASTLKIAYLDGSAYAQWTRSKLTNWNNYRSDVWAVNANGVIGNCAQYSSCGSRPAFTLPANLYIGDDGTVITNTAPSVPSSITIPG